MKIGTIIGAVAGAILLTPAAFADGGGRVTKAVGNATVTRNQDVERVQRGTQLEVGSALRTSADSKVEIWMEDDTMVALAPGTSFDLTSFSLPQKTAAYSLGSGGYRAVTGLIKHEAKTPVADIQVHGTDYAAFMCGAGCDDEPGLYARVDQGSIVVRNAAGSVTATAGQFVYVAAANVAPVLASKGPQIFLTVYGMLDFEFGGIDVDLDLQIEPVASPS